MKIKLNKNASLHGKINYLKLKYGIEGNAIYITKQVLRENPYDGLIQDLYEILGSEVKVIPGKSNSIAIYQNINYSGVKVNCIEVIGNDGFVIERLV